jgi:enterochelin esterase family protein
MGGGHTVQATNNNPAVFGWIGVWSAGGQDTAELVESLKKIKQAGVKHYWIGVGTTDFALKGSETLRAAATKADLPMTYHTAPGAHFWFIWRQFLGEYGSILFK